MTKFMNDLALKTLVGNAMKSRRVSRINEEQLEHFFTNFKCIFFQFLCCNFCRMVYKLWAPQIML